MGGLWVGIDDTDSPAGGCTTWALTELVRTARAQGADLIGEPRLVRLNPNVPWKTRGNAALAAQFGRGQGNVRTVGSIDGDPVDAFPSGRALGAPEQAALVEALWERLDGLADRRAGTDPALVTAPAPLPEEFYWSAVREVVPLRGFVARLDRAGARHRCRGSRRGLIGAAAAIAWPGRRPTWELIAYRRRERWGTPRTVDPESVRSAARREPALFLCDDPRTGRLMVAPHSPCPILFGLRGRTASAPRRALAGVRSEPVDRWMEFRTNQASGDHLVARLASGIGPYRSAVLRGEVSSAPLTLPGGHVRFALTDREGGAVACVAFEPTKTLPGVAASLSVGDRISVWGSRGRTGGLRLEGIRIARLAPRLRYEKPTCPHCARPARSLGRLRGFACPGCGRRWPPEARVARPVPARWGPGAYHPTPSARRHLAPLAP